MQPPLRPIVSSIGAYNYNLAKYLSSLLVPLLPDTYSVKDSFSFVEELRSFDFNDKFLISFDVESLFTNIPLNETIDIAVHLIFKHNPKFSIKKTDLKVPLRRKFLFLFFPFSRSNPFNEYVIAKLAIN